MGAAKFGAAEDGPDRRLVVFNEHASTFAGLPVVTYQPGEPADPVTGAWRLEIEDFEAGPEEFEQLFTGFLDEVGAGRVTALVIGPWGSAYEQPPPLDLLVRHASRLTALRALFVGDLTSEECEVSWINHGDLTPLLDALPALEILWVRGSQGLRLAPERHASLRQLVLQSGGLPGEVARGVGAADLPALEHLELWLGREEYGGTTTTEDLNGVLGGFGLPKLHYLALCNAEIADQVAGVLPGSAIAHRLETLDLSKGTLRDLGADALLAGPPLTHLRRLDLHHHFLSAEAQQRVRSAFPGVDVDLSDEQKPYEGGNGRLWYFTEVGE